MMSKSAPAPIYMECSFASPARMTDTASLEHAAIRRSVRYLTHVGSRFARRLLLHVEHDAMLRAIVEELHAPIALRDAVHRDVDRVHYVPPEWPRSGRSRRAGCRWPKKPVQCSLSHGFPGQS